MTFQPESKEQSREISGADITHVSSCQSITSMYRIITAVLITGVLTVFAGCGGSGLPDGKVRVSGKILLDGVPLTHAGEGNFLINLANESLTETSACRFDPADGTFSLVIAPGDYTATVQATDGFEEDDERRGRVIPAKSLVPKKYDSLKTSDAKVTVVGNGGVITVELTSE